MDSTGWAALAAGVSALVVGWQAWETRRTAGAATEALSVAREDLEAAKDSLALARESLEATRAQQVDAMKARLDARAAVLRVEVEREPVWPPLALSEFGEPQQWPHGQQFRTPRDLTRPIALRTFVRIHNAGFDPATVSLHAPLRSMDREGQATPHGTFLKVRPDETRVAVLEESRPLSEWIQNWRDRAGGQTQTANIVATLRYSDEWDNGVVDLWTIEMSGVPVRPVEDDDAAWTLNHWADGAATSVWAAVAPAERMYFVSKSRNEPLHETLP